MYFRFLRNLSLSLLFTYAIQGAVPNRYIVELTTEPVAAHVARASGRLSAQSVNAHRTRIHSEQEALKTRIEQLPGATVLDRVDTVANALLVRISDADAAKLAQLPGVAKVHAVRMLKPLLDRAAIIHKLPQAWAQVGIANAGAGIKIGIVDTGIDSSHPGFQDSSLTVPSGFPLVNAATDTQFTNNKVIVARSYASLFDSFEPDPSAADHVGHGTAVAMCAAGVQNQGPLATITGMAPKAFLGSYKVAGTPGSNDGASTDAILKAFDDAAKDGMDVINFSFGQDAAPPPSQDILVAAVEQAASMGVVVVMAAGNNGPDPNTIGSPASAPSGIAAGGSFNSRTILTGAAVDGGVYPYFGVLGNGNYPSDPIHGTVVDVSTLDGNGLACQALPANSLSGQIALILRGSCNFEVKLNNAQSAGAIAGLVYNSATAAFSGMNVGAATLPAEIIGYPDGVDLKTRLAAAPSLGVTLYLTDTRIEVNPDALASFSSRGPNVDFLIKPELVAVGQDVYTAAQTLDFSGGLYDPSGYALVDGTSFSSPITAGAAAVVKSFRPGLTVAQYRSLLIDNADPISNVPGTPSRIQESGGGVLDVSTALNATAASSPATLNFGINATDASVTKTLTISNVGTASETYTLSASPRDTGVAPQLSSTSITLDPGASADVTVTLASGMLQAGQYEGFIHVIGSVSGIDTHVPYWYGMGGNTAQHITDLGSDTAARRGSLDRIALLFRVTDAAGIPVQNPNMTITVVNGNGSVVGFNPQDSISPGSIGVDVQLDILRNTLNVFRVQVDNVTRDFGIVSQ